jgi:hypothetical protein
MTANGFALGEILATPGTPVFLQVSPGYDVPEKLILLS